jgi:type III secretory pathway lipoprotein EscJ
MQTRLAMLCVLVCSSCAEETVAHRQAERDANRILLVLEHYGIPAEKRSDGDARHPAYDVVVAVEHKTEAYRVLDTFGLPRPSLVTMKDLVAETSLIPSAEQERARIELGLMGDLVEAMLEFPLITQAHAAVSLPVKEPLAELDTRQPRPKASVVLQYRASEKAPPFSKEIVRQFVQARVPEIGPEEVHVEMIPSPTLGIVEREACRSIRVLGVDVCANDRSRLVTLLIGSLSVAGVFAALTMFAVLRAMRYRRELLSRVHAVSSR